MISVAPIISAVDSAKSITNFLNGFFDVSVPITSRISPEAQKIIDAERAKFLAVLNNTSGISTPAAQAVNAKTFSPFPWRLAVIAPVAPLLMPLGKVIHG